MPTAQPFVQEKLVLQELVRRSNNDSRRLKELEQRMEALDNRTKTVETTVLRKTKDTDTKLAELEATIHGMEERLINFQNVFDKFNKQVEKFAMRRDIKELEHMFDLFSPLSGKFVTKDELENKLTELREKQMSVGNE
ncbi:MAG: hypothetical protein ABIG30_03855 [Candidatus Aenigmatarchaeota archaeon]